MGNEEEKNKLLEEWLKLFLGMDKRLKKFIDGEEDEEEDYLIYQPLIYPPDSTPPEESRKLNIIDFDIAL